MMPDPSLTALASVPAAMAVVFTVWLFLRFFANERAADRTSLENHLSKVVTTLDRLVEITTIAAARAEARNAAAAAAIVASRLKE